MGELKIGPASRRVIDEFKKDIPACIKQVEWCGYSCEGGSIEGNVAWIAIKELISQPRFTPEEREAIKNVYDCATSYVYYVDNGKSDFAKKRFSAIATVRKMMQEGEE